MNSTRIQTARTVHLLAEHIADGAVSVCGLRFAHGTYRVTEAPRQCAMCGQIQAEIEQGL